MTPEAMAALHARTMTTPRPWSREEFAALLGSPGVFAVGEPTGFALGRVVLDEAELLTLNSLHLYSPDLREAMQHQYRDLYYITAHLRGEE